MTADRKNTPKHPEEQASQKNVQTVLRERAHLLARESVGEASSQETIEFVEFKLADERYGIESRFIREVLPLREFTPVPCTPSFVFGIVNVRGQIISVIDLKKIFQLQEIHIGERDKLIVLDDGEMVFGIQADVIAGVRTIAAREIQSSLPTLTGVRQEYLKGVTPDRIIVLDGCKLLTSKHMIVHEE